MRSQIEGSQAVARAVALCRPEVISAYPISPQTHIVEALSDAVRSGELAPCEYVMVESEFSAMSAAIGASATGARAYTATASQGLLFMAEALYNASGLGLPIVMTVANRAIGAPINIWNDHTDAMSQRDCGWIQLYAESNQEALDLHIQAFRLAEELSVPVMVCMDGFILTHAFEPVDVPTQEQVDAFLPPYEPRQVLDADAPLTIGAMVGPEAYTEVRYLAHAMQVQALDLIPEIAAEFEPSFGRRSGGLVHPYRSDDADTVVVALGSVIGTIQDVVDELRDADVSVGALGIGCFRPWPADEIRSALAQREAGDRGREGVRGRRRRASSARTFASHCPVCPCPVYDVVAGLGGRAITKRSLHALARRCARRPDRAEPAHLPRSGSGLVERELRRQKYQRRSGPHAENLLRDLGVVGPEPTEERRDGLSASQVLPGRELRRRQPPARPGRPHRAGTGRALQHADLRPPRLPGMRRGAGRPIRARRCDAGDRRTPDRGERHRLPRGLLDPVPGVVLAAALDPFAVRRTLRLSPPASRRR